MNVQMKMANVFLKLLNEHGDLWDDVIGDEFGNFDYLLGADIEFRNPNVTAELKYWGKWFIETTGISIVFGLML